MHRSYSGRDDGSLQYKHGRHLFFEVGKLEVFNIGIRIAVLSKMHSTNILTESESVFAIMELHFRQSVSFNRSLSSSRVLELFELQLIFDKDYFCSGCPESCADDIMSRLDADSRSAELIITWTVPQSAPFFQSSSSAVAVTGTESGWMVSIFGVRRDRLHDGWPVTGLYEVLFSAYKSWEFSGASLTLFSETCSIHRWNFKIPPHSSHFTEARMSPLYLNSILRKREHNWFPS